MEERIGFVDCGNVERAILGGLIVSGQVSPGQIWVYTPSPDRVTVLYDQFGINTAEPAQEVTQIAGIVFAVIKPGTTIKVLSEITSSLNKGSSVVSITAGIMLDQPVRALGHDRRIIRAMPNTPALVSVGITSVMPNALVTPEDIADVLNILRCFGETEAIAEPMICPVAGVSGSSSTYVFMSIEAMADTAMLGGMPRAQAYEFAAQAVIGSVRAVPETGEHSGTLRDTVYSPRGTIIRAVRILGEKGFRTAAIEAVTKCTEKSEKLSKS